MPFTRKLPLSLCAFADLQKRYVRAFDAGEFTIGDPIPAGALAQGGLEMAYDAAKWLVDKNLSRWNVGQRYLPNFVFTTDASGAQSRLASRSSERRCKTARAIKLCAAVASLFF